MRSSGQRPDDYRRFANSQSVDHLGAYVASHELRSSPKYRVWRAVLPASRSAAAGSLEPIIGTTRSLSPWNIQIGTSRSNRARATNCAPFSGGESHSDDDRSRTISRGMLPNDCVCCTQLLGGSRVRSVLRPATRSRSRRPGAADLMPQFAAPSQNNGV